MLASGRSLPQQPPERPPVAVAPHRWLPGRTMRNGWLPGRTMKKSAHQDTVRAQRIITAAKARAMPTVTYSGRGGLPAGLVLATVTGGAAAGINAR